MNAGLAWAVALDGLIAKHGISHRLGVVTQLKSDLYFLNLRTHALDSLDQSFGSYNADASSILSTTSNTAKSRLITTCLTYIEPFVRPDSSISRRNSANIHIAEGFLIQPLISQTSWPLRYDPFFRMENAIILSWTASRRRFSLDCDAIPTLGLGHSKDLDYTTKQRPNWLVNTLRSGLSFYSIWFKERSDSVLCRLSQTADGIAFHEGVLIKLHKLPLRSVWGISIANCAYQTRSLKATAASEEKARQRRLRKELASCLRTYLEQAEKELLNGGRTGEHPKGIPQLSDTGLAELGGRPKEAEITSIELAELLSDSRIEIMSADHAELP